MSRATETLARRLAQEDRLTAEQVIRMALEERAGSKAPAQTSSRVRATTPEAVAARRQRTEALLAEFAQMPILDLRSPAEIMDDLDAL